MVRERKGEFVTKFKELRKLVLSQQRVGRERAVQIVMDLAKIPRQQAESALAAANGSADAALDALGVSRRRRPIP